MNKYDVVESVKGKNVIITGSSTGIGEQLAYHYARLGANVVITARREQRLKEVCGRMNSIWKSFIQETFWTRHCNRTSYPLSNSFCSICR